MLKATRNQKRPAYFLQLDIRSFFMSIDKDILFQILEKNLLQMEHQESNALLYLLYRIIFHDCVKDYIFKGNPAMLDRVPAHKTLFKIESGKGLPIGNLTSQFFANVYLNELDQFVKHILKCRFYIRYVDDFILISSNKEQLDEWKTQIDTFLAERLTLELKKSEAIKRVSEGANFLGYIVRPNYILSRKRVVNNMKYKLALFRDKIIQDFTINGMKIKRYTLKYDTIIELRQILASYLGHFKYANSFNLVNSLIIKNPWLSELFIFRKEKLMDRFRHQGIFRSLRSQVHFFQYIFKDQTKSEVSTRHFNASITGHF